MVRIRSLLSTVIGENLIIVKVGKKPHKTHLGPIANTLHVEVKEDTWK